MTDDTIETASSDPIPFPDKQIDRPEPVVESEPQTATQRLRAFEDEHLGEDVTRIDGKVEKGHGSIFHRHVSKGGKLTDADRAHHAALENLIKTEKKLADVSADLAKAEAEHEAAAKAVDQAAGHVDAERE